MMLSYRVNKYRSQNATDKANAEFQNSIQTPRNGDEAIDGYFDRARSFHRQFLTQNQPIIARRMDKKEDFSED